MLKVAVKKLARVAKEKTVVGRTATRLLALPYHGAQALGSAVGCFYKPWGYFDKLWGAQTAAAA